ncbi:hypothetical protein N665_0050s0041 [Sinapis alba]|nr:hypothetical protein N665_0050s0041 [Sinapis alba]
MARSGYGSKGDRINLLTNHFGVNFTQVKTQDFFQYSVAITYEDKKPVEGKGISRKILAKVQTELGSKHFAYDGEKILYTVGSLPKKELYFSVVLEDMSRSKSNASSSDANTRRPGKSKKFNVSITFAAKIAIQAIKGTLQGEEPNDHQNAVRVMDVILRQNAATNGCLLVRQSFFQNDDRYVLEYFGGFHLCRGFHSSFRATQGGLSLNIDVSATLLVTPGPVIKFLTDNQGLRNQSLIDWKKAGRTLKNLRVKVSHTNRQCKITGLSKLSCRDEKFILKQKQATGEVKEDEVITVYKYFTERLKIPLRVSGDLPCINVGKSTRPTYIPMELCELVPLQRYTKALTSYQRSKIVTKSMQKPREKMNVLNNALNDINYNNDAMLQECGVSIGYDFTQVEGRILTAPKLKAGDNKDIYPAHGRWNFNEKKFAEPVTVTKWAVVNFSAPCNPDSICKDLIKCGGKKGMNIERPMHVFQENLRFKDAQANIRVEKMFEQMKSELGNKKPLFLLCILAEKKNSLVYGPWKKKILVEHGIVTQCIAPSSNVNDQYITNVLLKINAKLGGLNSRLAMELSKEMPLVTQSPTIIIGMDVSHGSPGSDVPSTAAVVGSRQWPLISKYRACVRTQPRRTEMIENLFKPVTNEEGKKVDEGIFWFDFLELHSCVVFIARGRGFCILILFYAFYRELLFDFYSSSRQRKPEHIIIFRDGVSESQFTQVLNIELDQMMQACEFHNNHGDWKPKFTVIISVKRHHTRFFQHSDQNVLPGTIVDSRICSPYSNDFYLCAHAGILGTSRPIHYHVLYDDIGFSTDELQELVHSLSYVYQRSTSAISQVAPVMYAHLAAAQMATAMKFEDSSETSSSHGGITTSGEVPVPPMPKLNANVASSMFFC